MNKNNYEINLLINGKPAREYYHKDRFYVEARQNSEYTIKIKNHSHKKIMAVLSVDGIDVLKGKSAVDAESGYIINPYSSTEIKGYRIDDNNVATFKFDDGKKSYSTQVEQKFDAKKIQEVQQGKRAPSKNNGVIGVRIWEEKEPLCIPEWNNKRKTLKHRFYTTPLNENSIINFFSYSGAMPANVFGCNTTGCNTTIGSYVSGGLISPNICYSSANASSISPNPDEIIIGQNDDLSNIDWNEWEVAIPRADVNQFGELSAVTRPLDPPTIRRRKGFIPNFQYKPNFNIGTSWGKQTEDKVIKVTFMKADTYIDLEIFYLSRQELINLGIDVENAKKIFISGYPKAFGKQDDYCKEPINWRKQ